MDRMDWVEQGGAGLQGSARPPPAPRHRVRHAHNLKYRSFLHRSLDRENSPNRSESVVCKWLRKKWLLWFGRVQRGVQIG